MSTLKYFVVDAFTTIPFKGNAAAVVLLDSMAPTPDDTILQEIAAEFNLSNTAFVTPISNSQGIFALRWFTAKKEVVLCGHATLASASVLLSLRDHLPENVTTLQFMTLSGVLTARGLRDGRIELEFPAGETTNADATLKRKATNALQRAFATDAQPNVLFVGTGNGVSFEKCLLIHVDGVDLETAKIQPGVFSELGPLYEMIVVTQHGHSTETFSSRIFAPLAGISEDPVTGSAHCVLGPYWCKKLQLGAGEMLGRQVGFRQGEVGVVWDQEKGTCRLRGHAKLFARGELFLEK